MHLITLMIAKISVIRFISGQSLMPGQTTR